jgi:hypothetical protein
MLNGEGRTSPAEASELTNSIATSDSVCLVFN